MSSYVSIIHNDDVGAGLTDALDMLPGLPPLFEDKVVAIKPNDTWASVHDKAACTQADTVRAAIRYIKDLYPRRLIVSGGAGAGETHEIFKFLGIDRVIMEEGVEFIDHNRPPFVPVGLSYGPQKEVMVNENVPGYEVIVSLSQLKVHGLSTVTLGMKNIAMSLPAADYYGHPREERLHPHGFFKDIHEFIVGMCLRFPIELSIITGHPAMTGKGPVGGRTFEAGLVFASRDFVAADFVASRVMGFEEVRHIDLAANLGMGAANFDDIVIKGITYYTAQRIFNERRQNAI